MTVCKLSGIMHMRKQQKPLPLLGVELPSLGVRPIQWLIQQNDEPRVRMEHEVQQDKPDKSTECSGPSHGILQQTDIRTEKRNKTCLSSNRS
jgi:hypothetical protein